MREKVKFEWRGNHHFYTGIFFAAFGVFQWYMGLDNGELTMLIPMWQIFFGVGIFMMIDDIIEHTITRDTPLRLLYEKVIRRYLK